MNKKYITHDELVGKFFLSYFLYSKEKFGRSMKSHERLGRLSAYKALMKLYRQYINNSERVKTVYILKEITEIDKLVEDLEEGAFKESFIQVWSRGTPYRD